MTQKDRRRSALTVVSDAAKVVWVIVVAIGVVALVRREWAPSSPTFTTSRVDVAEWQRLSRNGNTIGDAAAPVKIVEFGDYQCGQCGLVEPVIDSIIHESGGHVALVFRNLPLSGPHPLALAAAEAAECAASQHRFAPFHDALYHNQAQIGSVSWVDIARDAGILDLSGFKACVQAHASAALVTADMQEAAHLHLKGTPSFIIGGVVLLGVPSRGDFIRYLEKVRP